MSKATEIASRVAVLVREVSNSSDLNDDQFTEALLALFRQIPEMREEMLRLDKLVTDVRT